MRRRHRRLKNARGPLLEAAPVRLRDRQTRHGRPDPRLFAMVYPTASDGVIAGWDEKAYWLFWRPITAIREGDNDGTRRRRAIQRGRR